LAITNSGPGIARIKSIVYYVDRKSVKDPDEALRYGKLNPDLNHGVEFEDDDSLAVGQTDWLIDYRTKNKEELDRFSQFLDEQLAAEVNYCSVDGECWKKCSYKGRC